MKYLDILKKEIQLQGEPEKTKTTYHDVLQKVQKGVFTVFTVPEGSTFSEKKAQGYGCGGCGGKVYIQAEIWVTNTLPETEAWDLEHSLLQGWRCDKCGGEYQFIGGSKGPQFIN